MHRLEVVTFPSSSPFLRATSLVLAGLAAVLIGCSSEPDRSTAPRMPTEASGPAPAKAAEPMTFEGPGEKLPQQAGGLAIASSPRYFGPDNLYDLIDGGAEIYLEFGLVRMVTADYASPDRPGITVTVEVYDMGSPEGAFGRAARFLEGRKDPSTAGQGLPAAWAGHGIFGTGDLVVWRDRFLLHLTLLDESTTTGAESAAATGGKLLPPVAEAVLARIESDPPPPSDLALFPPANRLARSEAWSPRGLAGIDGLGAGCSIRYADGDLVWTAFATSAFANAGEAEAAWKTVLSAEAPGRRIALRVAGRRLVGAVADGEQAPPMERLEAFARGLAAAFPPD